MAYKIDNAEVNGEEYEILIRESDSRAVATRLLDPLIDVLYEHPEIASHMFGILEAMQETKYFRSGVKA